MPRRALVPWEECRAGCHEHHWRGGERRVTDVPVHAMSCQCHTYPLPNGTRGFALLACAPLWAKK